MALYLHNPTSTAHLEDLKDRLFAQLACGSKRPCLDSNGQDLVDQLFDVVRSMDDGHITPGEALEEFTCKGFPSFSKWLVGMVDEGVYLDTRLNRAA